MQLQQMLQILQTRPGATGRPDPKGCPVSYPKLLTAAVVAERADVNLTTVYRWITQGVRGLRLAATMVGGSWRVAEANLDAFLAELTRRATAGSPAPVFTAGQSPAAQRARSDAAREELRRLGV
jgi:excisionase family DNA binding protein